VSGFLPKLTKADFAEVVISLISHFNLYGVSSFNCFMRSKSSPFHWNSVWPLTLLYYRKAVMCECQPLYPIHTRSRHPHKYTTNHQNPPLYRISSGRLADRPACIINNRRQHVVTSGTIPDTEHRSQWRRNLFGRHGQSRTTFLGGTALNVNCRTTFQAHETFNHHVSDSQFQQTELTYTTRIQTLITQIIQKPWSEYRRTPPLRASVKK